MKPFGGAVSVSPTSGTEYDTKFLVTASAFNDTDDGLTFNYKFGYRLEPGKMITWIYEGSK